MSLHLEVITPMAVLADVPALEVVGPGREGQFGVLPGHVRYLIQLKAGELRYRSEEGTRYFVVDGGFAEIGPERVTVLARRAEAAENIDLAATQEAIKKLEHSAQAPGLSPSEHAQVMLDLEYEHLKVSLASRRA